MGLDPALFGRHPNGSAIDAASIVRAGPVPLEIRLPADLVAGCEFSSPAARCDRETGGEGSVQLRVLAKQARVAGTVAARHARAGRRVGAVRKRFESIVRRFRRIFPAALCYTKIVPVDEVVTLTLFYREDEPPAPADARPAQAAELDRLWDELHFVSQDALTLVDAFQQLMEYATQDADPKVFEPMRKPINDRAAAFRRELVDDRAAAARRG